MLERDLGLKRHTRKLGSEGLHREKSCPGLGIRDASDILPAKTAPWRPFDKTTGPRRRRPQNRLAEMSRWGRGALAASSNATRFLAETLILILTNSTARLARLSNRGAQGATALCRSGDPDASTDIEIPAAPSNRTLGETLTQRKLIAFQAWDSCDESFRSGFARSVRGPVWGNRLNRDECGGPGR